MDDLFESAWLKWAMAVVDAEVLQDNINTLAKQGELEMKLGMRHEYDPKRHCVIFSVSEFGQPFPVTWGPMLGNVVQNYRASLDHLAWALYKRGRTPNLSKWQEQGVYFPIAMEGDQFNSWLRGSRPKLPGVRPTDVAVIRLYQPYKAGKRRRHFHVLKVLDDLATADKHRTIQPVHALPARVNFKIRSIRDCTITRVSPHTRSVFKPGTELVRFYVRKTGPEPEIDVEPLFTLDPAVREGLLFEEWAIRTMRVIAGLLSEFSQPPESVRTMLGPTAHGRSPAWLGKKFERQQLSPSKG